MSLVRVGHFWLCCCSQTIALSIPFKSSNIYNLLHSLWPGEFTGSSAHCSTSSKLPEFVYSSERKTTTNTQLNSKDLHFVNFSGWPLPLFVLQSLFPSVFPCLPLSIYLSFSISSCMDSLINSLPWSDEHLQYINEYILQVLVCHWLFFFLVQYYICEIHSYWCMQFIIHLLSNDGH